jgi:hypothetical protein
MNRQSVVAVLSLLEIAPELFTHLHFDVLLQKPKWQFHGRLIFQEQDFLTHLSVLKLEGS